MAKKKEVIEDEVENIKDSDVVILLEILRDKIKNRVYSKDELVREIEGIIKEVE